MKNKLIRSLILCFAVAALALIALLLFGVTGERAYLEAAVAAGILFFVLLLVNGCFVIVAVRERRRLLDSVNDKKRSDASASEREIS